MDSRQHAATKAITAHFTMPLRDSASGSRRPALSLLLMRWAFLLSVFTGAFFVLGCKNSGCENDKDCKGDRVCADGQCIEPLLPKPAQQKSAGAGALVQDSPSAQQPAEGPGSPPQPRPAAAPPAPQVLVDEDIAVSASHAQMRPLVLKVAGPVSVSVEGKDNTAKGFNVFVMSDLEWVNLQSKRDFSYIPTLSAKQTRSFRNTAKVDAGSWAVVVQNSENILRAMTVHLTVTVNPRP